MVDVLRLSQESPLIRYAIRKLNPEIFSHPVWVRFWEKNRAIPPEAIKKVCEQAEQLQRDSPEDACQLLLASAVCQNIAHQHNVALETICHALELAKRTGFTSGELWAHWGACAICFQHENFDQAARQLGELQTILTEENDWILADFVDVIRQSLCQREMVGTLRRASVSNGAAIDLYLFTFQWFQKWGTSFQDPEAQGKSKWGIRLNIHTNGERQLSVWQSIRGLLRLQQYEQKSESYTKVKETQRPDGAILESIAEDIPTKISSPKIKVSTLNDNPSLSNSKSALEHDARHLYRPATDAINYIPVAVHMLGAFDLMIGEKSARLPASRGLSLLQYLLLHHKQRTSREVLMDIFWPDAEPETARNNLNVAIHGLRTALRSVIFLPVIIFDEGSYGLAPELQIWLDVEEFDKYVKSGHRLEAQKEPSLAVTEYETAISLYQGDFLDDAPYEGWTVVERERLRIAYLDTLARLSQIYFSQERYAACVTLCQLILTRDRCREDAHCRLMQCYSRLGQTSLSLRQYQICVEALQAELEVDPAPETTHLYERIHRHEQI